MDELVKMIAQKFGLPEDTVKGVVQMVVNYLKDKLPGPIGGQVEAFLVKGEMPQQAKGFLGGLFGKKR
jgi:hypothetical protein